MAANYQTQRETQGGVGRPLTPGVRPILPDDKKRAPSRTARGPKMGADETAQTISLVMFAIVFDAKQASANFQLQIFQKLSRNLARALR